MMDTITALNRCALALLSLLPVTVVKSAVVFAVVFALTSASKRLHPRSKYFLWVLVFVSLITIPAISTLVDSYDFRIS
jgi:beta-lactamase regulating signal transducer with metallopeptidase domain